LIGRPALLMMARAVLAFPSAAASFAEVSHESRIPSGTGARRGGGFGPCRGGFLGDAGRGAG